MSNLRRKLQREVQNYNSLDGYVKYLRESHPDNLVVQRIGDDLSRIHENVTAEEIYKTIDKHFDYDLERDFNINDIKGAVR